MRILKDLEKFTKNQKIALLIRHSDRNEIPKDELGDDILLNELGLKNAETFGSHLAGYQINKSFSSPVMRCVQTAEQIRKGYNSFPKRN